MEAVWCNKGGDCMKKKPENLADVLRSLSDTDLISLLPFIRDENGEKVNLIELKHFLKRENRHDQMLMQVLNPAERSDKNGY